MRSSCPTPCTGTFTCRKGSGAISVDLGAVVAAMLACGQGWGGESGKRDVASAILACGQKGGPGDMVEALAALGTTWLTHLLFVFYTSGRQPYEAHRQVATLETTTPHVWGWSGRRRVLCQEDMIFGDEYECILTGIQVWTHPALDDDGFRVELRACHILYRFIGTSEQEQRSDSLKSAQTTFDLLVEFLCLPARYIEQA